MDIPETRSPWICCQLGARRHYETPRALHRSGKLACLITDAWVVPGSFFSLPLPASSLRKLRQRFHPELDGVVKSFTAAAVAFELRQTLDRTSGWTRIIDRNRWFQKQVLQILPSLSVSDANDPPTLFSFSYTALEPFRYAKTQGWRTVLGQIDPGPVEERIVAEEHRKHPEYRSQWQPAPSEYWDNWQEECKLADRIIVSSPWSRQALITSEVPAAKIDVIPLAYDRPVAKDFARSYPKSFSPERPLKVLFLGQLILRKGMAALLEATQLLRDAPIEFWFVGSPKIELPPQLASNPKIHWVGLVSRSETAHYYQQADVFIFPTLSDGFGLTQLEAQAWQLPIIASQFCGEVVRDRLNGLILEEVTPTEIAKALEFCANHPQQLESFSRQSTNLYSFDLSTLQHRLEKLPYATV